ncbi:MAG: dipeptide/oligopeptide/nickel ABC transporter ATP-binding protein [Desulfurococcaceae archaeon]
MNSGVEVIKLRNVTAGYKTTLGFKSIFKHYQVVLRNINLSITRGEKVAIIGESGSGKSTLLKVIIGLLKPIKGDVLIYDKQIYKLPWRERVKIIRKIGYVPQDPYKALNPLLKIRQILAEPLEASGLDDKTIEQRVREVVRFVGLQREILDATPDELSGGMRQRVLIARALIADPEILILDEPTSALDVSIQAQIINLLNDIYNKLGTTMITVTHDLAVAQYLADRAIILKEGTIVDEGSFDQILSNPRSEYTRKLILSYYVTTFKTVE